MSALKANTINRKRTKNRTRTVLLVLNDSFAFNRLGKGIRWTISCMAPIGQLQPQKSLLPMTVTAPMKARSVRKTEGTAYPASRNRNGFEMTHSGLGCRAMADAILPKGKAENIPKVKNTRPRIRNRVSYFRRDLTR